MSGTCGSILLCLVYLLGNRRVSQERLHAQLPHQRNIPNITWRAFSVEAVGTSHDTGIHVVCKTCQLIVYRPGILSPRSSARNPQPGVSARVPLRVPSRVPVRFSLRVPLRVPLLIPWRVALRVPSRVPLRVPLRIPWRISLGFLWGFPWEFPQGFLWGFPQGFP